MLGYLFLVVVIGLAGLWLLGPREPVDLAVTFDEASIGDDVDAWLAQSEARYADIEPDQQKQIAWAYPKSRASTPVSLVYLHGFSASRFETHPMSEQIAETLDANVFYTRLAGHGRAPDAMAEPSVNDWINDTAEAIAIGERIGAKTVLVAVSTGGTLAAIAAMDPGLRDRIDAIVFISPNFKLKAATSAVLTFPFARSYVHLLAGERRGFEPMNDNHAAWWTENYPSVALLPMAAAVAHTRTLLWERTDIPALFILSDADRIVDAATTRNVHARWGGPKALITVDDSDDPNNHVLAGDALSPSTTQRLAGEISTWITQTLGTGG